MRNKSRLGMALTLIFVAGVAWAAATPPLVVDADHSTAILSSGSDTGRVTYDGHVVITHGNTVIRGAQAIVYTRHQHLTKAVVTGAPTHFSRQPRTGPPVQGVAQKITYLAGENRIVLEGDATLHRGAEVFHAATVNYDLDTQVLKAHGQKGGRVHVVIPPARSAAGPAPTRP